MHEISALINDVARPCAMTLMKLSSWKTGLGVGLGCGAGGFGYCVADGKGGYLIHVLIYWSLP